MRPPAAEPSAAMEPGKGPLETPTVQVLPWLWRAFDERVLINLATAVMLLAMGVMFYEAANRSLTWRSNWWAEEAVRFLVVWAVLLALGPATRRHHFIRMDLLVLMAGRRVRLALGWLNAVAGLGFSVVLLWTGIEAVQHLKRIRMMTDSNLDLPMWVIHLALPIGAALWGMQFVMSMLALWRGHDPNEKILT